MRIAVWNLAKAAGSKLDRLRALQPDVAIVPECEATVPLGKDESIAWCGRAGEAGLAVLGFGVDVRRLDPVDPVDQWVMSVAVGGPTPFSLLAVWADNSGPSLAREQLGPLRHALPLHPLGTGGGPWVVGGDFNNGQAWDHLGRSSSHCLAVEDLEAVGLTSAYHRHHGVAFGEELEPTYYGSKDLTKAHHIDYLFAPGSWTIDAVTVADYADHCRPGAGGSDHAPLVVDITVG